MEELVNDCVVVVNWSPFRGSNHLQNISKHAEKRTVFN